MDDLEDLQDDNDGILTDDEALVPDVEVRVPPEWTSKMSTKALAAAEKMPLDSVLKACAQAIESRVLEEKTSSVSLPLHVWNQLWQQQGGNHKATEAALAELINGVEAAWSQHKAVHLFGELCGMLTAEHSAVVTKRVLSLLSGDASPALVPRYQRQLLCCLPARHVP